MSTHRNRLVGTRRESLANRRKQRRALRFALPRFESLETRALLAGDFWQNQVDNRDVNADGRVSPLDALIVINDLNAFGSRALFTASAGAGPTALGWGGSPAPTSAQDGGYLDVSGDGRVSPLDALSVINALDASADPLVRIRVQATDLSDNPIASIAPNSDFKLRALVLDLRAGAAATGVFAAYTDVTYNNLATIPVAGPVTFSPEYQNGKNSDLGTAGLVNETGAFSGFNPLGPSERLLWSVPVHAGATTGIETFTPDPADIGGHEVLLYGIDTAVPVDQILYVAYSLNVAAAGTPALSINDVTQVEGDAGTQNFVFTVSMSVAATQQVTVPFSTSNGSAISGADYAATNGIATFAVGQTSRPITVVVNGDVLNEANETFSVNLATPTGGAILADSEGLGTITDNDPLPALSIDDRTVTEGTGGSTNMVFNVTLNAASGQVVTANFSTANGNATAGSDYTAASGVVSFNPGEVSKPITIAIVPDSANEVTESFQVNLTNPVHATIAKSQGVGTILDDDTIPTVSVVDAEALEGNTGTTSLVFTVTLSAGSGQTVTVGYTTANGTATAPTDYVAQSGTLTFTQGVTAQTITVAVNGDKLNEPDETFTVTLSNPSNATLGTSQATGTILNDDPLPVIAIDDPTVVEGNGVPVNAVFTISINVPSGQQVTVNYATADGSATTAGNDYVAQNGVVTFVPGETSHTVTVSVLGDVAVEGNENFLVNLSAPANAALPDTQGVGTILDDDGNPSNISIVDTSVLEGNFGPTSAVFDVFLLPAAVGQVTVVYNTVPGTASTPGDFAAQSGTITFQPGSTLEHITIQITGDIQPESNEDFFVNLSNPVNAAIADAQARGTIIDDDPVPDATINDVSIIEGNSGQTNAIFTVTLSSTSTQQVTIGFATQDNTAKANLDYLPQSGNLTFAAGETSKQITVPVLGDGLNEGNETFFVNLSSAIGATIIDAQGIGTIIDDDQQGLTIKDAAIVEGNTGTTDAIFTINLASASNVPVTVTFTTADSTATVADNDYVAANGILTFDPGQTSKTVTVAVNGDTTIEADETFFVNLSNASNAIIVDSQGVGTIFNDDPVAVKEARIRLEVTDLAGTPITTANKGDKFNLKGFVQDLRLVPQGVFAAYLDVFFNSSVVTVSGPIIYGTAYPDVHSGTFGTPGLIDEVGAQSDSLTPLGPAEQLLFSVEMTASNNGLVDFLADPADVRIAHEVLVYGQDTPVLPPQVLYVNTSLQIGTNFLTVSDVSHLEGNAGTTDFVFDISRVLGSGLQATVVYATADGTATSPSDYISQTGTLTFAPGDSTQQVTITVKGDVLFENDETFTLVLSNPTNVDIGAGTGTGTILNDDTAPTISINDASADEGNNLIFTVSLSAVSGLPVTVVFATANATTPPLATAGADYTPTSGALTFTAGQTTKTITVATIADILTEPDEKFRVLLSSPTQATIADGEGIGTIVNAVPNQITGFVYVDLNNNGVKDSTEQGIANVIVTATNQANGSVSFTRSGIDGSYFFILQPGVYDIAEVQPGFFIDGTDTPGTPAPASIENDKFVGVTLSSGGVANGFNFGERGLRPEFAGIFMRRAFFASSLLTGPYGPPTTTQNLDLTQGDIWISFDGGWNGVRQIQAIYNSLQGTVNLALFDTSFKQLAASNPGDNPSTINFKGTLGTTYFLRLSGSNPDVAIRIVETLSIGDVTVTEGNAGTINAVFTVTLSNAASAPVTVTYATSDITATAGADYVAQSGTLTFAPGTTSQTLTIAVNGELVDENNETFRVDLTAPTNVVIFDAQAVGSITDDDPPPTLTVSDATIVEGNGGTTNVVFTVTLSGLTSKIITVGYSTAAGSAKPTSDFNSATGTLTFGLGVTTRSVTVAVLGDTLPEPDESFFLNLINPVNATISDSQGVGTITNDDGAPFSALHLAFGSEEDWLA